MPHDDLGAVLALPENRSLAVDIAERLRAAILGGHFGPGERLREEALARSMGVSRGPVREAAEEHFRQFAPTFEIGNEVDFVRSEAKRLRLRYPKIAVAPLLFRVEDNRIYAIRED